MATFYLSADTGNDSNSGTLANPWLTISKAHSEASDGDTIILLDSSNDYTWADQTFTKDLTFLGEQPDGSGAQLDGNLNSVQWTPNSDLVFSRLTFKNRFAGGTWGSRMFMWTSSNHTLEMTNCMFKDIEVGGRPNFLGHGLFTATSTAIEGINIDFKRNTLENTVKSGVAALNAGVTMFNFRGVNDCKLNIFNNTFHVGDFAGEERFEIFMNVTNSSDSVIDIANNIFYVESNQDMQLVQTNTAPASIVCEPNVIFEAGSGTITNIPTGDNIFSDPLLVDVTNNNYNLRPSSPAINTGRIL